MTDDGGSAPPKGAESGGGESEDENLLEIDDKTLEQVLNELSAVDKETLKEGAAEGQELQSLALANRQEDLRGRRQDRRLRKQYASDMLLIMVGQLVLLNVMFWNVGNGQLTYSDWLFHAYMVGTFGEIVTIIVVITKYLFPKPGNSATATG